jgi:hypothetical protein
MIDRLHAGRHFSIRSCESMGHTVRYAVPQRMYGASIVRETFLHFFPAIP